MCRLQRLTCCTQVWKMIDDIVLLFLYSFLCCVYFCNLCVLLYSCTVGITVVFFSCFLELNITPCVLGLSIIIITRPPASLLKKPPNQKQFIGVALPSNHTITHVKPMTWWSSSQGCKKGEYFVYKFYVVPANVLLKWCLIGVNEVPDPL